MVLAVPHGSLETRAMSFKMMSSSKKATHRAITQPLGEDIPMLVLTVSAPVLFLKLYFCSKCRLKQRHKASSQTMSKKRGLPTKSATAVKQRVRDITAEQGE